jgi:multiple sugar transport system ATP-binding protein
MPGTLSAGERGAVGIGRALIRVPSVFLLDEPLAHLDAAQRLEMRRRIVTVVKELGVTTLYVTHDQADALAIADRVALLNDGVVVQDGTPLDLYERPANLFVAGFVGTPPIGLLPARLVFSAGTAGYQVAARTLPLWAPMPAQLRDRVGQYVVLGVRPEHVYDATAGCDPEFVALPATVLAVEHTGPVQHVTLAVQAPPVTAPGAGADVRTSRAQIRARFPARVRVPPGTSVQIAVDVGRAHVFDGATGEALWNPPPRESGHG